MFPARACCCKEEISLDTPKGNLQMRNDYLKGKVFFLKGRGKDDKDKPVSEAVKKVQMEKNLQAAMDFPSTIRRQK